MKRIHKQILILMMIVLLIVANFYVYAIGYKTEADNWYQLHLNAQKAQTERDEEIANLKQDINYLKSIVEKANNK